jgi:hypothetical protein
LAILLVGVEVVFAIPTALELVDKSISFGSQHDIGGDYGGI